jgi:CheY-like chemotaxis protein
MTRAPRKTKRPSSAHILIAEDEPMIVALLEELLKDQNYTYETANNGLDVITKWRAGEFDLILMDVQMPNMNGLDVTRAIRNEEVSKSKDLHIPIVALTAHASEDDRRRCIEAGMDAYVGKPISQEDFYQAIRNGLLTKQSS